jgi:hypothetical protein
MTGLPKTFFQPHRVARIQCYGSTRMGVQPRRHLPIWKLLRKELSGGDLREQVLYEELMKCLG